MSEQPKQVEIKYVHKGKSDEESFYEFLVLATNKTHTLTYDGFVKRYGVEPINSFKKENNS